MSKYPGKLGQGTSYHGIALSGYRGVFCGGSGFFFKAVQFYL